LTSPKAPSNADLGLKQVLRRTGLTRWQLIHLEERGLIDGVARTTRDRRVYTAEQVELMEDLAVLRSALGLGLDEAARVASEMRDQRGRVPRERLEDLAATAMRAAEQRTRLARRLADLARSRPGTGAGGAA
jgi:DNA-binding transcriptional MerR regulator